MTRNLFVAGLGLCVALAGACQKDDSALTKRLDTIEAKQDQILKKLDQAPALAGAARPAPARPARPRPPGPNPADVFAVPIDGDPVVGPDTAKITIVKGFEFACPFCLRVDPTLEQLQKDYGDDIRIVYKDYVVHPQTATTPALAACAAHKQGKYKPMYELIWEKGFKANRNLGEDNMKALAKELGLDLAKFTADMNSDGCRKELQQDQAQLAAVGTHATPAFYINGRYLAGAQPIDRFKALIDEELSKFEDRAKSGAKPNTYYTEFVIKKGKRKL